MLNRPEAASTGPFNGESVAVLGGGLMGSGIAAVFGAHGHEVTCVEPDGTRRESFVDRVTTAIEAMGANAEYASLVRAVAALDELPSTISYVTEAVPEDIELKRRIIAAVTELLPEAVVATNTSVFRIGDVACDAFRPERVVGSHWWNPAQLIPLVEVVQGPLTSDDVVAETAARLEAVGKMPVHVMRDTPGFVGNRLQHAMWREAMALVDEGVCDAKTIDLVVKNSFGLRLSALGPLENADYVGLELTRSIHEYLLPLLSNASRPADVLDRLIADGRLGASLGGGFHEWTQDRIASTSRDLDATILLLLRHRTRTPDGIDSTRVTER